MRWKNVTKFLLGISLALAILISGGVAVALYFLHRVATPPAKPVFSNDSAEVKARGTPRAGSNTASSGTQAATTTTTPEVSSTASLSPGTYKARVTWAQGLSVRSEPSLEAERIGGVGYNEELTVLETNSDKSWQKIRIEDSEQEGWVKAGNVERIEE
ncbi:SH3 domain-containing protein [Gloeocapsopsis dulcis]|uniref:Peptide-binding protein n=1 Tax=Gloeocapsopsis dulcis AAB1 = 1H9 TaxID=1433147 RepID=A0A6N8FRF8_9CHRO|nr:SH3 domain-containing protein [Gloeocapsopsis dulcis]MUL34787.1 peptide-binding protein [Gloeocapsopsis dulcis AAB1 = 1H9]WNN90144.1 SH3 domain-containing protein [Gloeocapsopsis dulcis]